VKTEDFYVSCGCNDNYSVWFSGTVMVGCGCDPKVVDGSDTQTETPSRDTVSRDSI
jgi:hypothetical protein